MSLKIRALATGKENREELLALVKPIDYSDGRTKQCYKDECDIDKIMTRFDVTGTISHLAKYEGVYADFSDFDFHKQSNMLARGSEIFDALPAELRDEFRQSPARFFAYVNDPKNHDDLRKKLPGLAQPGRQLPAVTPPEADAEAALAAAEALPKDAPIAEVIDPAKAQAGALEAPAS